MVPNITHNWVVVFHPGADAMGKLGSVPVVLSFHKVNPSASVPHIVSILQPFCMILRLLISFCLLRYLNFNPPYSCRFLASRAPSSGSTSIHSFNIGLVTIYWYIVFCQRSTYVSTSSSPASFITSTNSK